ncbi:MAG TPA: glycosyltransferase [Gemmatimonadaceae bacterium]|jgi:glycosyltransferase involved in cell wall biosynthesis/folate-dependent phosphoribosylglycinamide formyltransferase PurN
MGDIDVRIVVLTALPDIESTPWWPIIANAPGITGVLIVHKTVSRKPAAIARRLLGNVRKHGLIFVPYRAAVLAGSLVTRVFRHESERDGAAAPSIEVRRLRTLDMHHPYVLESVQDWEPDLAISIGAPILRAELFELPRLGTLNLHLGKVPEFRGAPPGFWELWYGAQEIGATVHWIDAGLDTGAIMESACAPIYERDTLGRVEARAAELGRALLASAVDRVAAGDVRGVPQRSGGNTNRMPTLRQRFALWRRLAWRRLRARASDPLTLAKLVVTLAWLTYWRPLRDLLRTIAGRHPVRVFTYHRVTDLCRDGMTVSEETFRQQLEYLGRHHTVVDLDHALEMLQPGRRLREPVAVITFDDGYRSVGRVAQPAMKTLEMPGTCFVCTDVVGTDAVFDHDAESPVRDSTRLMDWTELERLQSAGWRIGAHTKNHTRLSSLDTRTLAREVSDSLPSLRQRLPATHVAMAYPFGGESDITLEGILAAKGAGYSALASNFGGENFPGDDPFAVKRIDVGGDHASLMWKAAMHGLDLSPWRRRFRREQSAVRAATVRRTGDSPQGTPRRPLRVTQIVFDLEGGGMETLVAAMVERWRGTDVQMSVITLSGRVGRVGERLRALVEQFHVPSLTRGLSMIAPGDVVRALRATRPDVVHVHTGAWPVGAYAARLTGVRGVVYTEHGREHHDPLVARIQDHVASRMTTRIACVSERLRGYLIRELRVRPEKAITILNGVDTEVFAPGPKSAELRESLDIPADALILGSVGRLEPVKAYARLVAAYARLRETDFGQPLVLVIFGEGSDRAAIEREVDRLGVRDGVRMPGWTDHPADAYRLLDVFAMTSKSEGMSVSLMEAMACGVSPVVTDVGSNAEVLGTRLDAQTIAETETGEFDEAVRKLLVSPELREQVGTLARRNAVAEHSLSRMLSEYERVYWECTSRNVGA